MAQGDDEGGGADATQEQREPLHLDVKIEPRGACQRHLTVTIAQEDVERYLDEQIAELMPKAQVRGFRPGRAPRKLVAARFRKEMADQVKSQLLLDSLAQIHEEQKLVAISEPDIDLDAIELPEQGPLTFEFDLEVRPEFDLPDWRGIELERPVREFTREDVDAVLTQLFAARGRFVPVDEPARLGDAITANLSFRDGDRVLERLDERLIRLRPVLSFRDGEIEGFGPAMAGVRAGETRELPLRLSPSAPNAELAGRTITAVFEVLDVKRFELPEFNAELLSELGFKDEGALRDAVLDNLEDRLAYEQRQTARRQITSLLTAAADWELPPELLRRQSRRELERAVLELRRSGFSEDEIRVRENRLRRESLATTALALKEHFILERIAEEEGIEATDDDYDFEIMLIARQSGQSPRRVRARFEKSGTMDVLRNQIVERKVIELILEHVRFRDVQYELPPFAQVEAIDRWACGREGAEIPEAKADKEEAAPLGRPEESPIRE